MVGKAASLHALDPISPITHDLTNPTLPRSIDVAGAGNAARTERHERRGERGVSHEQLVRDRDRGGVPAARAATGRMRWPRVPHLTLGNLRSLVLLRPSLISHLEPDCRTVVC